ncbi:MAG TPA: OB-fold domain-containing protein [Steroidobacteraceae bacterium]|nr:OB-fold domain-containing protein [Steroidobacteraceae bacterium]
MTRPRAAAIEGWYTLDEAAPALIGSRCTACGTYFFPPLQSVFCRNPECAGERFERVPLSRTGRIWSFTDACYQPPEPYVAAQPFVPFAIAAVELDAEKMIVLGQVVSGLGVKDLRVGMQVELVLETLYADAQVDKVVWKWKPAGGVP